MTARDTSNPPKRGHNILRWLLAATFVFAGVMHFVGERAYAGIMPSYLPYPRELVRISGVCEIAGGIGVLAPQPIRRWAGWGLIALLIAVFPANIEMARRGATIGGRYIAPIWWLLRLPLQAVFIGWVNAVTRNQPHASKQA